MDRPKQFAHYRHVGDKRSLIVYDIDELDASASEIIAELMEAQTYLAFAPDTVAEARNRGYELYNG